MALSSLVKFSLTKRPSKRINQIYNHSPPSMSEGSKEGFKQMPLAHSIRKEQLEQYFHLPINEVAKKLGVCATVFKKICRRNGVPRWPHRKVCSLSLPPPYLYSFLLLLLPSTFPSFLLPLLLCSPTHFPLLLLISPLLLFYSFPKFNLPTAIHSFLFNYSRQKR